MTHRHRNVDPDLDTDTKAYGCMLSIYAYMHVHVLQTHQILIPTQALARVSRPRGPAEARLEGDVARRYWSGFSLPGMGP